MSESFRLSSIGRLGSISAQTPSEDSSSPFETARSLQPDDLTPFNLTDARILSVRCVVRHGVAAPVLCHV